jgi:hypothetical protein
MGIEAFTAVVPKMTTTAACRARLLWGHLALLFELPVVLPMSSDKWTRGPLVIDGVGCVGSDNTRHHARCFPKRRESG